MIKEKYYTYYLIEKKIVGFFDNKEMVNNEVAKLKKENPNSVYKVVMDIEELKKSKFNVK